MFFSDKILKHKLELEAGGCKPDQCRMAPDVFLAVSCEQGWVGSKGHVIHGMKAVQSKNIPSGCANICEDAKKMRKRMEHEAQKGREG